MRRRAAFPGLPGRTLPALSVATVAILLAGCVAPNGALLKSVTALAWNPGSDSLKLGSLIDLHVPMTDGIRVHGTVYLPSVANGTRVPVLMDMGPYYGDLGGETNVYSADHPPSLLYEHFLRNGYAIALVSVRGTGQSEGCFMVGGPQEIKDTASMIQYLAAQPWSNGKVAMIGISYDGSTPYEGLASGAPNLTAIIPGEGITDMYRYTYFDGVPVEDGFAFNTYYVASVDWAYTTPAGLAPWALAQPTNVCPDQSQVLAQPYATWANGAHSPFYQARDTTVAFSRSHTAAFLVEGFDDWNVRMDEIQWDFAKLPEPKRMLLGQWEHNVPWRNSYNPNWDFAAYNDTIQEWLDAYMRGDAAAVKAESTAPAVLAQDSTGRWWNLSDWPPAQAITTPFFLAPAPTPYSGFDSAVSAGRLAPAAPNETSTVTFRTDPAAQAREGSDSSPPACVGTVVTYQCPTPQALGTEVDFSTPTLAHPLFLMGNPTVRLPSVTVNEPGGYLDVVLYDQAPDGTRERVDPGYLNLAERNGLNQSESVPVGSPMNLTVRMYGLAHVFPAGHRMLLVLTGNDPNAGGKYQDIPGIASNPWTTSFTVKLGGSNPAAFEAPVFPS
jgi:putative CocE/NonD family hydrolase